MSEWTGSKMMKVPSGRNHEITITHSAANLTQPEGAYIASASLHSRRVLVRDHVKQLQIAQPINKR